MPVGLRAAGPRPVLVGLLALALLFSRASVTRFARAANGSTRVELLPGGHGDYWATPAAAARPLHRTWLERRL